MGVLDSPVVVALVTTIGSLLVARFGMQQSNKEKSKISSLEQQIKQLRGK